MSDAGSTQSPKGSVKDEVEDDASSDEDMVDSEDEDETIARIQRAHYAQVAAMNARRRAAPRSRPMSAKRKMEAVRNFQDFTKKLKKDTGINIKGLVGNNILDLNEFSSDGSEESDGLSETEFEVNPSAVQELNELNAENESYIDPETGDIVEAKKELHKNKKCPTPPPVIPDPEPIPEEKEEPKTLSISDIINDVNDGELDLSKNVECAEVDEGELCSEKTAEELLNMKQEGEDTNSQDYDITEKLKEMGEISVKPVKEEEEGEETKKEGEANPENEDEKKPNPNAVNVRRNIREVMDEKNLDASTLAAQRQESERLARVQEQQRIIREVQRQIALNRQNKIHQKTLSLLSGGSSILKQSSSNKLNLPNTVLVKLPSGETKKTTMKQGQLEVTKVPKPTTSAAGQKPGKPDQKTDKKEVVEIVDSSSGEESSSSSSDSDDCIMLSDSEVPPSPEAEEDPNNSGLHVNDAYNIPDEQGRVLINIGHPENEEDIFLAPQIARVIKPHQIGGVRFLFDNIIESVERFSTSTGFGCILAHSMGLGKTLQIVCFTDIFLRHTSSKTVLCIMPINTLQNWVAEFNMWLPLEACTSPLSAHGEVRPRNFPIYVLNDSHKTLQMRAKVVKDWKSTGGVLMIGYELYRLLSMKKDKKPRKKRKGKDDPEKDKDKEKDDKKDKPDLNEDTQGSDITMQSKMSEESKDVEGDPAKVDGDADKKEDTAVDEEKKLLDEMYDALVKPGPDLVICDEGHRIKNSHSNISYALKQMRTKRRVVLTGYPLQNNLIEYWCMVDFVRPNYLGSKTEFCNMFERPIQNGQCIDSTPQDIRLMRYRAHVLHSLLVGFVQRRSHAVLQSTLPQKEEYVLLVRMTPLQRKLYDYFMNEVVRCTSVPNPLKAFAICCKIWNHPDVLYNFLRKRSEANAAIEEDLDLEELRGVTKAGRNRNNKTPGKRGPKPRGGAGKKPAATIPPNMTGPAPRPDQYGNAPFPPNGPYGPNPYQRPDQGPYPYNYQQQPGYYPPNQYNQNYDQNYYNQQPYNSNYPNQYPQNNPEWNQGYNQNNWGNNSGYYGNNQYYNNQYPNGQPPQDYNQQYPPNYTAPTGDQTYPTNAIQPYTGNQEGYGTHATAYQQPPGYSNYNNAGPSVPPGGAYPNSQPPPQYPNTQPTTYPNSQPPPAYPNNQPTEYPNQSQAFPPGYTGNTSYGPNQPPPYNQYENQPQNYPGYANNMPPTQPAANDLPNMPNQEAIKAEPGVPPIYPTNDVKPNINSQDNAIVPYGNPGYNYNQPNTSAYPDGQQGGANGNYPCQYPFPSHLETKPPLDSAGSNSPVTSWPITELKTEVSKLKLEEKAEIKSESDGEVKIEDLDTRKIVKDESKMEPKSETPAFIDAKTEFDKKETGKKDNGKAEAGKSDGSESEEELPKRRPTRKSNKKDDKSKGKSKAKPRGRKDRKTSKDKNKDDKDNSESEESEKEEKLSRGEELALSKKAEEMTYDWAAELLKEYIPGIIENSAKMELFFYILNESIKMGDRLLLFSQSLFTLNLIEDFLERNYIPGKNCVWERNVNYYRLDGSTHALEREKLINEFNANPNIYLFLVSTRAGSLGINLVGANRVIVFDASWNPCHDTQAVCRVYRYGQKKPCFVYRFVMDWCLEKKIYDRQINKQGMADRVVDECNPDAVLSMKEITNLCFDNDEKETEAKDLTEHKDKYIDVLMQGILVHYGKKLSKEPFQHESLLVDRKEKKLSSAEKRLAQRGYELEKKAALAPKPTTAYRTVRAADGSLVQRPVASVRPMQHGARWIPADVWRRQGMTAQEMTLPLDVVIPTNSAEKTNIVLKAGQRVMVLKSPKGIYMQLESGKIIAIKTSIKGLAGQKGDGKDTSIGKKVLGSRPSPSIPGSLKNNSAITITSKTAPRPGFHRIMNRPNIPGQRLTRPLLPGQKIQEIRNRLGEMRSYTGMRPKFQGHPGKMLRPHLPGSVSITKIPRDAKKGDDKKMDLDSEPETQVLDSDDDEGKDSGDKASENKPEEKREDDKSEEPQSSSTDKTDTENNEGSKPLVLTTDEKLPTEEALDNKLTDKSKTQNTFTQEEPPTPQQNETVRTQHHEIPISQQHEMPKTQLHEMPKTQPFETPKALQEDMQRNQLEDVIKMQQIDAEREGCEKKINPLKNYRHQRPTGRPSTESSLSILEKTASVLNKEGMPDFRKNLDDITQSYSPGPDEKPTTKSKKKKSPNKLTESQNDKQSGMSHSISSMLGSTSSKLEKVPNMAPVAPLGQNPRMSPGVPLGMHHMAAGKPMGLMMGPASPAMSAMVQPLSVNPMAAGPAYPAPHPPHPPQAPEGHYGQYPPGYGMGYGGYPNAPPYYGGYGGGAPYYPGVAGYGTGAPAPYAPPAPTAPAPAAPPPDGYLPPNPQW